MAVAWDAFSNSTGSTDPSWTHTPAGTPRGVVVFIIQDGATAETVSCTYGGTAMTGLTAVDGSANGEPARVYPFFLGASVPTGAQTVAATADGAATKVGFAHTFTATDDTEVVDQDQVVSSSQDDPTVNLTATDTCQVVSGMFSGLGTATNVTAGSGYTKDVGVGTGGDSMHTEHRTSVGSAGTVAASWTTTAGDDVCMKAVLVQQVAAAGGTEFTQTNTGTLTTSGNLIKGPTQIKGGTLTTSGVLKKDTNQFKAGTLTLAGVLKKDVSHFLAGTLTLAGTVAKTVNHFLAGVLGLAGTHDGQVAGQPTEFTQTNTGTLTLAGNLSNVQVTATAGVSQYLHRDVRGSPFAYRMVHPMGRGRR